MSGARAQFAAVLRWELRYYLTRVSTWVYFAIFFALGALLMSMSLGAWDDVSIVVASGGKVKGNAPYSIAVMLALISLLGVSVTAALAGNAVYRDYEAGIHPLFYTSPLSKPAFLGGRFVGSVLVNLVVLVGIGVGMALATAMPWVDADKVEHARLAWYVAPYLTVVLPNLLFTAALFFGLAALTRQMLPNYAGGVLLLMGYLISGNLMEDLQNKRIAALLDPFALRTLSVQTEYWSIAEKNARLVSLEGLMLVNRLAWVAAGLLFLLYVAGRFRFSHVTNDRASRKARAAALAEGAVVVERPAPVRPVTLPATPRAFGARAHVAQFRSTLARAFWGIVRNRYFAAIVGAGLLFLIVAAQQVGKLFGTTTWPVTYQVEEVLSASFGLFVLVVIAFYAGELVWAERDVKAQQIHDATPTPTAATMLAKLVALWGVLAVLLAVTIACGVATQAAKGYARFELPLYLQLVFGVRLVDFALLAVLALTIHVLANHKYVGHLLVILAYIGTSLLPSPGVEHHLLQFNGDPGVTYSDMNRFGPFLGPYYWFKLYWAACCVLLAVASTLFWSRGEEVQPGWRTHLAAARFRRPARVAASLGALSFLGLGGFIWHNTNQRNTFRTQKAERHLRAAYEQRYKKYARVPQPRIVAVDVDVALAPERRAVRAAGTFVLRNRTPVAIDTLHVRVPQDVDTALVSFDRPATRVLDDRPLAYQMWRLAAPLAPGDSLVMRYVVSAAAHGFTNTTGGTEVVDNGTFVNSEQLLPSIGYSANLELSDDDARKKEGLKPKERMRPPTDPAARADNYIGGDADWVTFHATVSTAPDQIAIAPGYLTREWAAGGRRHFEYAMDAPILNFFAFLSARYAVKEGVWVAPEGAAPTDSVRIAVYYHPAHAYNVDRMIRAVRKSLDYYTASFGPYQHRQVRILEFPRYASFAQSFPNTIPYSEEIGFIARVDDPKDIDYPFYVTAHEVAHQWWAHQLIGADAQGSTLMSETLAQYSALMVMEHEYGRSQMRRFLEYELDRYLVGRSTERKKEQPLDHNENQPYIHYRKGSLAMYALKDYLGEARLNAAIRAFNDAHKFHGPPYPTGLDFVAALKAATPDSLQYLIEDQLETITLYENRADSARVSRLPDGTWAVDLVVTARKLRADSLGNEREVPIRGEWIDVGVFADSSGDGVDRDGVPLYLAKRRITSGTQRLRVVVNRKPARAGIDPLHVLIDRQARDNVVKVSEKQ